MRPLSGDKPSRRGRSKKRWMNGVERNRHRTVEGGGGAENTLEESCTRNKKNDYKVRLITERNSVFSTVRQDDKRRRYHTILVRFEKDHRAHTALPWIKKTIKYTERRDDTQEPHGKRGQTVWFSDAMGVCVFFSVFPPFYSSSSFNIAYRENPQ